MQRPAGQPQQQWGQAQPGWGQPVVQRPVQMPAQPPYQGGYPPAPPQRGGNPLKLVLLGVVAAIAVGFFAFSLTNFLTGPAEVAGPTPSPTSGETTPPQPSPEPTPEPSPTPEIGDTPAPPVGVPEPDFDPPELPFPRTWEEVDDWLVNNAIYTASLEVPTNCTLGRIDVQNTTVEALQEHLNNLTGCLMMVWQEPVAQAGFVMPRPPITVYTTQTPITTACGVIDDINAAYCPADQRMYYHAQIHLSFQRNNPELMGNAFLPDLIMGHEFGHAIQGRTGIIGARIMAQRRADEDKELSLELSRRNELQADCFAGAFLNAVAKASRMTDEERAGILAMSHAIGDDSLTGRPGIVGDHGWGENRELWTNIGMSTNQQNVCNTYVAPSEQVR